MKARDLISSTAAPLLAMLLLVAISGTGCPGGGPGTGPGPCSLGTISCPGPTTNGPDPCTLKQLNPCATAKCHGPDFQHFQIDITTIPTCQESVRAQLIMRPSAEAPGTFRIVPGSADQSFAWHKLQGTHVTLPECKDRDCGVQMPKGMDPLTNDQLKQLRDWINAGAKFLPPDAGVDAGVDAGMPVDAGNKG